ncbi:hypothetical protein CC86DRAFT_444974 [Ophiobolus disseminans]|uniref:YDG domain-containing protein n=1 Tax=Ophiobolus disseminans TaxID=1469910 RepID=A0A6A7A580_9PLEO|nr:hypothetical protein CC86DRAFT_444974 [Ophiobolus disseminans]
MLPDTPRAVDLSRPRLKQLTKWIRDDLDLLVARQGPNALHPDDVLTLHDTFVELRYNTDITVLDLRATGIHRAIQDIAGVATRWPGRLCDDCDKIIALWTERFGLLSALHPFLFGRGGRLEGIASATEYSREALLKRWSETCPEKLRSKVSHRLGDLGFKAGDWWINTFFAHHAGIIGIEAVEGGTTFDKYGAYAVVLKDTGEVDAISEDCFTYRVPQHDKGKFRLTAATPGSRDPIRVLRSHSINSIWGPKAGVRYEGLYGVKGWSIRQAKSADMAGGEWKAGDIVFEVRFERKDPVSMEEVSKRPTCTEVDDYSEYKRLRKIHREGKRHAHSGGNSSIELELQQATKAAPPIMPLVPVPTGSALKTRGISPSAPRKSLFMDLDFNSAEDQAREALDVVSPMTVSDTDHLFLSPSKRNAFGFPVRGSLRHLNADSPLSGSQHHSPATTSKASSEYTATSARSNIREVAPWIDFDAGLTLPSAPDAQSVIHRRKKRKDTASIHSTLHHQDDASNSSRRDSHNSRNSHKSNKSNKSKDTVSSNSPKNMSRLKDASRKSIFVRTRNPMAKLFDGPASITEDGGDYFGAAVYSPTPSPKTTPTSKTDKQRQSSSDHLPRVHSPIPIRPFSPDNPFYRTRRGAIYSEQDEHHFAFPVIPGALITSTASLALPNDDPFVEPPVSRSVPLSIPMSLKRFISRPLPPTPLGDGDTTPMLPTIERDGAEVGRNRGAAELLRSMGEGKGVERIVFRNPFSTFGSPGVKKKGAKSEGVLGDGRC